MSVNWYSSLNLAAESFTITITATISTLNGAVTKSAQFKHVEGGWPESVKDPTEPRDVNNWKRTREKTEDFPGKVKRLIHETSEKIKQNLRMDIYEEYFDENETSVSEDNFSAKVITVYKDVEKYRRSVNKVVWISEDSQTKFAIAYRLHKDENVPSNIKLPVNSSFLKLIFKIF